MMRWRVRGATEGYDEYMGHTISGAADVMFPAGRRAQVAREMRATLAYWAHVQRSERMGKQSVRKPLL